MKSMGIAWNPSSKSQPYWIKVAYAPNETKLEEALDVILDKVPDGYEYLVDDVGLEKICLLMRSAPTYGHRTNNVAESTNSVISESRQKGPLMLAIDLVHRYQARSALIHQRLQDRSETLLPKAALQLQLAEEKARLMDVQLTSPFQAIVKCFPREEAVDLLERSCTCFEPREYGWPCAHIVAAQRNLRTEDLLNYPIFDFFEPCFKTETCCSGHSYLGEPIIRGNLQIDESKKPAVSIRRRGRPQHARILSAADRLRSRTRCANCRELGHNRRRCPQVMVPASQRTD